MFRTGWILLAVLMPLEVTLATETEDRYAVSWNRAGDGQFYYELHRKGGEYADRDTLIYRGRGRGVVLVHRGKPEVHHRVCTLAGCGEFLPAQVVLQPATETRTVEPTKLIRSKRSRSAQRLARQRQPRGSSLAGVVEIVPAQVERVCDPSRLQLGEELPLTLPGTRATTVTSRQFLHKQDGSWSWYSRGERDLLSLNMNGGGCNSRPFGAYVTSKGSYWIRPLGDSASNWYAVYRIH